MVSAATVLLMAGGASGCGTSGNEAAAVPIGSGPAASGRPAPVSTIVVTTGSPTPSATPAPAHTTEAATPAPAKLRIMPLGDSITYGLGDDGLGSYREVLGRKLAAKGLRFDFVGSMESGPPGMDRDNEGHVGWRIAQIAAGADRWMATYRPDVVLLHIGTNDMRSDDKAAGAPDRLSALIDQLLGDDPDVHVFVAEIIGADDDAYDGEYQERIDAYNALIPGIVALKGERVHLVDQHRIDGDLLGDTFHPNKAGYRKMANTWYRALNPS